MAEGGDEWVKRVLGVEVRRGGGTEAIQRAMARWQAASDAVDDQIAQLQAALRRSGDEELAEIAEYGLNGVTGNHKVPLLAALIGAVGGNAGDRAKLPSIVSAFRAHLETGDQVEACDENPFGVTVTIRSSLVEALGQVESALA
jgi:hypothetical protein